MNKIYPGIEADPLGPMSDTAKIIRDAQVFGLIGEGETCAGWPMRKLEDLYEEVSRTWERYGMLVSGLPPELRERHARIHGPALERARADGWEPPVDED
jgi:hypothetical protein